MRVLIKKRRRQNGTDDRKVTILKAIIKTYLKQVSRSSRTISKYTDLKLSSATIRTNVDLRDGTFTAAHLAGVFLPIKATASM